ncbi:MAG: pantoate--beta-alanine ligase [Phycisphaerae bacterium]|nr:pantoate--beta-alanine ligase [Phycisphaerae bacterium]
MNVVHTINEVRSHVRAAHKSGKRVGLVPTMGALHPGHMSLVTAARKSADDNPHGGFVAVSIFINPTQFAPGEDLDTYPKTLDDDLKLCEAAGVDLVFAPGVEKMYPREIAADTTVTVSNLPDTLCGKSRPGHFAGVCTVVAKLFNIVQPDEAFFGAKDFQQAAIIRQMVADLNLPVDIIICPIIREADGLAMSSRNVRLTAEDRKQAPAMHAGLALGAAIINDSHTPAAEVIDAIEKHLRENAPAGKIDYIQIVDPKSLQDVAATDKSVLIAMAVKFGDVRLIDNILIGE